MLSHILLLATVLAPAAVTALSPPYTTQAPDPECRLSDPVTACPTYANCYGSSGCSSSGCPGYCAPTSSCTIGSNNRTCTDAGNSCTPFYSTCTTDGCFGACISTSEDLSCPEPSTCTPTSPCTTEGCEGNCIDVPTPTTLPPCVISDSVSTCGPSSICTQTSPCSTSGCGGLCLSTQAPLSPCVISDPTSACTESGSWTCTQTSPCSTSGCGGLCLSIPTPLPTKKCTITASTTASQCKIDDPASSCNQTPVSSCAGANGCTTSGCEGTCTRREACDPVATSLECDTDPLDCADGEFCSSHSGSGYCHTIQPTGDSSSYSSSSSSSSPLGPGCTIGGDTCNGRCYTCIDLSGGCTTDGCVAECLGLPCTSPHDDSTSSVESTTTTTDADVSGVTADPTEPPLLTRTYDCLVSVTGHCGFGEHCEPWYGQCCDTLNCPGRCVGYETCDTVVEVTKTVTVYTTDG